MKKTLPVKLLCAILCISMILPLFAACKNDDTDEAFLVGDCSSVAYNAANRFTTTLTIETGSFKEDVSTSDVSVVTYKYKDSMYDVYDTFQTETVDGEEYVIIPDEYIETVAAEVNSVAFKDAKNLEITFTDTAVLDNTFGGYDLIVKDSAVKEKKEVKAAVMLAFADNTLTPSVTTLSSDAENPQITLVITEGSFAEDLTENDIYLSGAFAGMQIESLSAAGQNMTVKLSGSPVITEGLGFYEDGVITVASSGIVDGYADMSAYVDINAVDAYIQPDQITYSGGELTLTVVLTTDSFTSSAKKEDFTVDGFTVLSFEAKSSEEARLTVGVAAEDINAAVEALNGKTISVASGALASGTGTDVTITAPHAAFYPVFDYAEVKNDNLELTLLLNAEAGWFSDALAGSAVSFADGFEGAAVVSLTRDSDYTATLVLSLPAQGMTEETLNLDGTVALAAGSLVNTWNTPAGETSYTRNYAQDSMGKDLSAGDIGIIKDIVGGFGNTTFGTISSVVSGGASAISGIYTVLQVVGICESPMSRLAETLEKLDELQTSIEYVKGQIAALNYEIKTNNEKEIITNFRQTYLNQLDSQYENLINSLYSYASKQLPDDFVANAESEYLAANPKLDPIKNKADYNELMDAVEKAKREYLDKVFTEDEEKLKAVILEWYADPVNVSTISAYSSLTTQLCNLLINRNNKVGSNDPIVSFDKYVSYLYNYQPQAYQYRLAFRGEIYQTLSNCETLGLLITQANCVKNNKSDATYASDARTLSAKISQAISSVDETKVYEGYASYEDSRRGIIVGWIYCYTLQCYTNICGFSAAGGDSHILACEDTKNETLLNYFRKLNGKTIGAELIEIGMPKAPESGFIAVGVKYVDNSDGLKSTAFGANVNESNPSSYVTYHYKKGLFSNKVVTDRIAYYLFNDELYMRYYEWYPSTRDGTPQ